MEKIGIMRIFVKTWRGVEVLLKIKKVLTHYYDKESSYLFN